jgi:hypothetical protein
VEFDKYTEERKSYARSCNIKTYWPVKYNYTSILLQPASQENSVVCMTLTANSLYLEVSNKVLVVFLTVSVKKD